MFTRVRAVLMTVALTAGAVTTVTGPVMVSALGSTVTGVVFEDTNVNGANNSEDGVTGVTVKAYDSTGNVVGTTTTGADGTYSLSVTSAGGTPLRVEFTNTVARMQPSIMGTDNGGDVQFVNAGATAVNWALQIPGAACENLGIEPSLAASRIVPNGYEQGVAAGSKGNCFLTSVFLASWSGHKPGTTGTKSDLLRHLDTGSTYGLAYDKGFGLLWNSAFIRRHSGLGPKGVGGLYVTSPAGGLVTSFDLEDPPWSLQLHNPSIDFSTSARGIDNTASPIYDANGELLDQYKRSLDLQGFAAIGKQGIGDIAIDSDSGSLYLTNLYQRSVQRLQITGTAVAPSLGSTVDSWSMPAGLCPSNFARPFGLYLNPANGRPWVGIVCSGETTPMTTDPTAVPSPQDGAFVYELNTSTGAWTEIVEIDLAYPHQAEACVGASYPYAVPRPGTGDDWPCWWTQWNDWSDDFQTLQTLNRGLGYTATAPLWYSQPMVAGIEQLADGSLVIGLMDRWNYMLGWENLQPRADAGITDITKTLISGDILLLCKTATGYQRESDGTCTSTTRTYTAPYRRSQVNAQAEYFSPGATVPAGTKEFFADNLNDPTGLPSDHTEMSMGAVAVWPKSGPVADQKVAFAAMDPWRTVNVNGIRWNSADNGDALSGLDLQPAKATRGFDKNAGLGGIEIVCDRGPLEIGNRAWRDTNSNGVQDVGEAPIVGATVRLYKATSVLDENLSEIPTAGELVGTAVTDANGQYRFNSVVDEAAAGNGDAVGGGIEPNTPFVIKFDNPADFASTGPLYQLGGTTRGATAPNGANSPAVDSDLASNDYPTIFVPPTPGGAINHDYDAGFVTTSSIGNRVWIDADGDGIQDSFEPGYAGVLVKLLNPDETPALGVSGDPVYAVTDSNGFYVFGNVPAGTYKVRFVLPDGASFTTSNEGSDDKVDSDADTGTGLTGEFTLAASATGDTVGVGDPTHLLGSFSNPTIDAGLVVEPATISDLASFEGIQTNGLTGDYNLIGVRVELTDPDGNPVKDFSGEVVQPTYTDNYGYYLIENLFPGRYRLKFTLADGLAFSPRLQGTNRSYDSDAYPDGTTDPFTLLPGAYLEGIGVVAHLASLVADDWYVRIGNYVWLDADEDGVQDAGEQPVEGVNVYLRDPLGYDVASTVTDANGRYLFEQLLPGTYTIMFEPPTGFGATLATQGADVTKDSDALPATSTTAPFTVHAAVAGNTLKGGADRGFQWYDETIDAGFVPIVVAVGDFTWIDSDEDGLQDEGEPVLPGVFVELYDANGDPAVDADGDPVPGVYTDENGFYLFDNLTPGEYQILFTLPEGLSFTWEFEGTDSSIDSNAYSDGWTDFFWVTPSDADTVVDTDPATAADFVNPTIDAGVLPPLVGVGDFTWIDSDEDGIQDDGEPVLEGVMVELLDSNGDPVLDAYGFEVFETYTDGSGYYFFDDLVPGDYRIRFTLPTGYVFTTPSSTGSTSANDSNPVVDALDPLVGLTPVFTIAGSPSGDTVFDADDWYNASYINPTIDAGVVPLVVAVGDFTWIDSDADGVQDDGEPVLPGVFVELFDPFGNSVDDADGNLVEGVYTDENGFYLFDNLLPGDYTALFTLPEGYRFTWTMSGDDPAIDSNAWSDGWTDEFSIFAAVEGNTVVDTDPLTEASFVDPTIDAGVIGPIVAVGDYVWYDLDRDGVQDEGEDPIEGVEVTLLDANGDPAFDADGNEVGSVFTDENGYYFIDGLLAGDYRIQFTLPDDVGYAFTGSGAGSDRTVDSNPDRHTGLTPVFSIDDSVTGDTVADTDEGTDAVFVNPTIDAGVVPVVAVSNYMWFDTDYDGVRDLDEATVEGATVLLLDADGNPAVDADGDPVPPAVTDELGFFLFDNLVPGDYRLQFVAPAGYAFTGKGSDDTDETDSNANPDGFTDVFSVEAQALDATSWDDDAETAAQLVNPTVGAGLVMVVAVGDRTWMDTDRDGIQDAGEPASPGVLVTLLNTDGTRALDANGEVVPEVRTDANGNYLFDNLLPGDYRIRFTAPTGYLPTLQGAGASGGDSDPDRASGVTPVFTIGSVAGGDTVADSRPSTVALLVNPTIDAGFVPATIPETGSSSRSFAVLASYLLMLGLLLASVTRRRWSVAGTATVRARRLTGR